MNHPSGMSNWLDEWSGPSTKLAKPFRKVQGVSGIGPSRKQQFLRPMTDGQIGLEFGDSVLWIG